MTTPLKTISRHASDAKLSVEVARLRGPEEVEVVGGHLSWQTVQRPYATSLDAITPLLFQHTKMTGERAGGEPEVFRIYSPADAEHGWTVEVVWLHHDGDLPIHGISGESLEKCLCLALLAVNEYAITD